MSITLNQVARHAKDLLREPVSETVSVTLMEDYVRQTYFDWCQELFWPEADLTMNTVPNQQEYALPDTLNRIFRVYVNGQRAAPTTIALLEGDARGIYNPTWRVAPAVAIPPLSASGGNMIPITAAPSFTSLKYYIRGGFIGFHPKPAAQYEIRIEGAVFPLPPQSEDPLQLPDQFKDGLAYGGCYRFLVSDRRPDEAAGFKALEQEQFDKAMRWRRRLAAGGSDNLPLVTPHPYRDWYARRGR